MNTTRSQIRSGQPRAILTFLGNCVTPAQAVLVAMLFVSCSPRVEGPKNEAFEQTYEIDPDAGLSIRNTDGSIVIHGTETAALKLRVVKKASNSEELKGIDITATAGAKSVSITTRFLPQKHKVLSSGSRTVDYTMALPRTVNLTRVDLENGKVLIERMRGELQATVVDGQLAIRICCGNSDITIGNGALDLYYEPCDRKRFSVDAKMTNGNARLFVQRGAPLRVHAETMAGKITNEFGMVNVNGRVERNVDISTGSDVRHEIKLRLTTGDIKIAEPGSETANSGSSPSQ